MTRIVVVREGEIGQDKRMIAKGAVRVEDVNIPVCLATSGGPMIGLAREMERDEETGDVSFDIWINPDVTNIDPEKCDAHIYASPYSLEEKEDHFLYIDARVREITLIPQQGWSR